MKRLYLYLIFLVFCIHLTYSQLKSETERSGDMMQITLPITAFAMTILQNDSEGSYQFLYSFLTTTALTHIVKHTIPDDRPNGGSLGMVSGHTVAAFQSAAFVHFRYGIKYAVIPYIAASYVAYSRVYSKQHDGDDVLNGFILAMVSTYFLTSASEGAAFELNLEPKSLKLSTRINF